MIIIKEVKTKKQIKDFLNFPLELYKDNKYYVPALYGEEKKMFSPKYLYYDQSEAKCFNAYKDGKIVGRIQGILQKASNKKWKQKRMRFSRFDCINDQEVANKLFEAVEQYAKEKGMNEVVGPLGFSDLEREGLLIEGFDYENTFEEQYNFDYYQKLIEKYGFKKEVDWIEHRLFPTKEKAQRVIDLGKRLEKKSGLRVVTGLSYKQFAKRYKQQFFKMLDDSYDKLYGTVPFSPAMKDLVMYNYAPLINMNYLLAVVDKNDKIKSFSISFPSISDIVIKSKGHLYPKTIYKLLRTRKKPKVLDFGLVGTDISDPVGGSYASAIIMGHVCKQILDDKIEYCETNLNLVDNKDILGIWEHFDHIQHKRRRCYCKSIK